MDEVRYYSHEEVTQATSDTMHGSLARGGDPGERVCWIRGYLPAGWFQFAVTETATPEGEDWRLYRRYRGGWLVDHGE